MISKWFVSILILVSFGYAQADTILEVARSWPCADGKSLGLYLNDRSGILTPIGYCDFELLKGFRNNSFEESDSKNNYELGKKCRASSDPGWVGQCFERFKTQCFKKIHSDVTDPSSKLMDAIDNNCLDRKDGSNPSVGTTN